MNPKEIFQSGGLRDALPGENWDMTREEAHCFDMELSRLQLQLDPEAPAVSHWIALLQQAFSSGKGITNSTPELFAYVQGAYPAAVAHLGALRPQDPEMWSRALADPLLLAESGMTEEQAETALEDAEAGVVRLPCGHTATEHLQLIDGWYERNLEATRFRRSTLYHVWNLPPEEKLYGRQFISRYDMDREIREEIDRLNRSAAELMDPETRSQLIMDLGKSPDEADALLEDMKQSRTRKARADLEQLYEQRFRILG